MAADRAAAWHGEMRPERGVMPLPDPRWVVVDTDDSLGEAGGDSGDETDTAADALSVAVGSATDANVVAALTAMVEAQQQTNELLAVLVEGQRGGEIFHEKDNFVEKTPFDPQVLSSIVKDAIQDQQISVSSAKVVTRATNCPVCDKPIEQPKKGRPKKYCSDECRYAAADARKIQKRREQRRSTKT